MEDKKLVEYAIEASRRAHAPYSHFYVGAALLLENGDVVLGCNVENASYGLTNCAERTALFSAIAQGHRSFKKMAIFVDTEDFIPPCGACRQVIFELAPHIEIILSNRAGKTKKFHIKNLLPLAFGDEQLKHGQKDA